MTKLTGEIRKRELAYVGAVFNVEEHEIELTKHDAFGRTGKQMVIKRQLVTKAPCVVAMVKHMGTNNYLVTKEFRVGSMNEEYGFVAGMIDEGESAWDAVIRELREETGYQPILVKQLGESYSSSGFTDEHITYFYIEVSEDGKVGQDLDDDEIVMVEEKSFKDILYNIKFGGMNGNHVKSCILHYILDGEGYGKVSTL